MVFYLSLCFISDYPSPNSVECDSQEFGDSQSGQVTSPGYGRLSQYENNVDCHYQIRCPTGKVPQITFDAFDLEAMSGDTCVWDYVEVKYSRL